MTNTFSKIHLYIVNHKIISSVILIVLVLAGYFGYRKAHAEAAPTRYVLRQVERGTLISSVSGAGQVASSNQLDIKPKVSGEITSIKVKSGQEVKGGTVIAQLNARDASQSVREALADLTSAKISLEKTKRSSSLSLDDAKGNVTKAYEDGYNTLSDTFTSFSSIVDTADDILNDWHHSPYMENERIRTATGNTGIEKKNVLVSSFAKVKAEYEAEYNQYKALSRVTDMAAEDALIAKLYATSKKLTDSLKEIRNFVAYLQDASGTIPSELTADKTTLDQNISTVNGKVTTLLTTQNSIKDAQNAVITAEQTYSTISGSNKPLDVQAAELTVLQKQNAYQKALNTLSDYTVRAPFDGVIAASDAKVGDSASSGTTLATIITKQKIATISLNELDAAKVKVGQKTTLTFDAFENLTISGQVIDVSSIGTVSQGVVSYTVKIALDTQDDRIKPGMSVSASIITQSKPNVLIAPSSAVKTNTNGSYVEILTGVDQGTASQSGIVSPTPPQQVSVETGSSNDNEIEIISGLTEGDQIVIRTITASSQTATQRSTTGTLFGGQGAARAGATGGNTVRFNPGR
jgi:HlyD family secretion protein